MDKRYQELNKLKEYTTKIEKEVTLLLQNLQWDQKYVTEKHPMVTCKYNSTHTMPTNGRDDHEERCYMTKLGYSKEDTLLPDPADAGATSLVKFTKHEIAEIINNAACHNPMFKRGLGSQECEPLTVERLQRVYTADERRAIHDAVVSTAPLCHDLTDLELLSSNDAAHKSQKKSRLEILAELRDMKRRRVKYRVAPAASNYSHVLRDLIKTQMDSYGEATKTIIKTEYGPNVYVSQQLPNIGSENVAYGADIKLERESPETNSYIGTRRDEPNERHIPKSTENKYNDSRRSYRKDTYSSNKESRNSNERRSDTSKDYSRGRRHEQYERSTGDKYSSRNITESYDHQRKETRDKNRDKIYKDRRSSYYSNHSSRDRSRHYESHETYVKTEPRDGSSEPESNTQLPRTRNGDTSKSNEKRLNINTRLRKEVMTIPKRRIKVNIQENVNLGVKKEGISIKREGTIETKRIMIIEKNHIHCRLTLK